MTTKYVNYVSTTRLPCTDSTPAGVILIINSDLNATPPKPYINATLQRVVPQACNPCSPKYYVYQFSYDDSQLQAGYSLMAADIYFVVCRSGLTEYIDWVGNGANYVGIWDVPAVQNLDLTQANYSAGTYLGSDDTFSFTDLEVTLPYAAPSGFTWKLDLIVQTTLFTILTPGRNVAYEMSLGTTLAGTDYRELNIDPTVTRPGILLNGIANRTSFKELSVLSYLLDGAGPFTPEIHATMAFDQSVAYTPAGGSSAAIFMQGGWELSLVQE